MVDLLGLLELRLDVLRLRLLVLVLLRLCFLDLLRSLGADLLRLLLLRLEWLRLRPLDEGLLDILLYPRRSLLRDDMVGGLWFALFNLLGDGDPFIRCWIW